MSEIRFRSDDLAMMIPGQNSQAPGMGERAFHQSEMAKRVFYAGSRVLGEDLKEICFGSQTDKLDTPLVQSAIVAAEMANYFWMEERGLAADLVMPHSLGEFAALGITKAVSMDDVFRLTQVRTQVIEQASANNPGRMSAVLGPHTEQVSAIMAAVNDRMAKLGKSSRVYLANHNWTREHVLSGHEEAIERYDRMVQRLKGLKILDKVRLVHLEKIKGGNHSPLNQEGVEPLLEAFRRTKITQPSMPILGNNGRYLNDIDLYPEYFANQLVNGVDWHLMMHRAAVDGIRQFVEVPAYNEYPPDKPITPLTKFVTKEFRKKGELKLPFGDVVQIDWVPADSSHMSGRLAA